MEKNKTKSWASKRAEWVKELAAKPEDLSLVPESCNVCLLTLNIVETLSQE